VDRIAFALMDVVGVISWFTWTQKRYAFIPIRHVHDDIPGVRRIMGGTCCDDYPQERWCWCERGMGWVVHDGWKPARYA
jgi:hypothetical protein